MFVVGCLQGTGSLTGNLGQRKPTQRCQLRGKKKTDRGADMVTAWAHTHFFSYNHRGGDYKLWLRQPPAVCCKARYCEVTHAIKSQTRPRTRCGSWPNLACAWSHETTETLVWRFMVGRWWLMLCSLMQHLNKLPHHEVKWLCRMTKVHEERLQSEAVLEIGALHPSVLSRRQEISEDYRQRRVPAGHRNIQKYVINPHTHAHTHCTHLLSDLERYKLLSTLLDPSHRAEHKRSLIKGAKIKNQWVHRQVQTTQVHWTDSKVLHPSPFPHSLLIVHFTLQCVHVLPQLVNLVTFCISRAYSEYYMPEDSQREEESGCVSVSLAHNLCP